MGQLVINYKKNGRTLQENPSTGTKATRPIGTPPQEHKGSSKDAGVYRKRKGK